MTLTADQSTLQASKVELKMTYIAFITFTAESGNSVPRWFLVTNPSDILRCGIHLAKSVGGNNVQITGWKPFN